MFQISWKCDENCGQESIFKFVSLGHQKKKIICKSGKDPVFSLWPSSVALNPDNFFCSNFYDERSNYDFLWNKWRKIVFCMGDEFPSKV